MEKNKSYAEYIIDYYSNYQSFILNEIYRINDFQRTFGFKEFNDMSIRCCNSNVNAYKQLKKMGLNPDDSEFKIILNAYNMYVLTYMEKALASFERYITELEMIFIGKQNTLKQKIKELNPEYNSKELYLRSQYNVENYLKYAEEVMDLDIERDMDKILENFLNKKFVELTTGPEESLKTRIDFFNSTLPVLTQLLRQGLTKMNLQSSIYSLNNTLTSIIAQEDKLLEQPKKRKKA